MISVADGGGGEPAGKTPQPRGPPGAAPPRPRPLPGRRPRWSRDQARPPLGLEGAARGRGGLTRRGPSGAGRSGPRAGGGLRRARPFPAPRGAQARSSCRPSLRAGTPGGRREDMASDAVQVGAPASAAAGRPPSARDPRPRVAGVPGARAAKVGASRAPGAPPWADTVEPARSTFRQVEVRTEGERGGPEGPRRTPKLLPCRRITVGAAEALLECLWLALCPGACRPCHSTRHSLPLPPLAFGSGQVPLHLGQVPGAVARRGGGRSVRAPPPHNKALAAPRLQTELYDGPDAIQIGTCWRKCPSHLIRLRNGGPARPPSGLPGGTLFQTGDSLVPGTLPGHG